LSIQVRILVFTHGTLVDGMNQNYPNDLVELITWYNSPGKPPLILSLESTLGYFEDRVANSNNDKLKDLISSLKTQIQLLP
jgi:hypothetical protein